MRKLSPEVAKVLARHHGDGRIDGDGIKSLSIDDANAILDALEDGGDLSLNGLTTITPDVAEALGKHKGDLSLDGLATITPEVAEALAKHEGDLALSGVTTITPEALKILRANPAIYAPSKFDE